jgi:hypothetical protein
MRAHTSAQFSQVFGCSSAQAATFSFSSISILMRLRALHLYAFNAQDKESIVRAWEDYARTTGPPALRMDSTLSGWLFEGQACV